MQDAEDRLLEQLLQAEPIADDGFTQRVQGRIRRQIWVRRLALPLAIVIGLAIAAKPALQLVGIGTQLLRPLAGGSLQPAAVYVEQLPLAIIAVLGFALAMATFRLFEE